MSHGPYSLLPDQHLLVCQPEMPFALCVLVGARVGAGQGNSVEDKRVRLESEDFDARWLRRGVLADRDSGTLQVHVPRSLQPAA